MKTVESIGARQCEKRDWAQNRCAMSYEIPVVFNASHVGGIWQLAKNISCLELDGRTLEKLNNSQNMRN
ncbi:MAG: hypothetical protein PHV34_09130 [Verrucomicrobiae bacterium]|nr:hypothetical protein [Verrucomicrobiae bacterium]